MAGTYEVTIGDQAGSFIVEAFIDADAPIAYWGFNEGSGTTTNDGSGNDNHGILMGDTFWTQGPTGFGTALSFDGDGDSVVIANESNFDFDKDTAFTIEAWVKTDKDKQMRIIGKGGGYSVMVHDSEQERYETGGGNKIYVFLISEYDSSDGYKDTDAIVVFGSTAVNDGEWHQVSVTYDGSNQASGIQIYVDGEPEEMHIRVYGENKGLWDTIEGSILNDVPLGISSNWDGLIDEVKIWRGVH